MRNAKRLATSALVFALALTCLALPAVAESKGVVNINSADAQQFQLLPRIGPSVAERILAFRTQNGPFKSTDDLMLVTGIGEKTFALIKPHVVLSGETTLGEKVRVPRSAPAADGNR
jgi:competence ComEA-like helix-hairpin-helix protein